MKEGKNDPTNLQTRCYSEEWLNPKKLSTVHCPLSIDRKQIFPDQALLFSLFVTPKP